MKTFTELATLAMSGASLPRLAAIAAVVWILWNLRRHLSDSQELRRLRRGLSSRSRAIETTVFIVLGLVTIFWAFVAITLVERYVE
jgi:hypothetical protein